MKTFQAEILSHEKYPKAAYVEIPFDVKKEFGRGNPLVKIYYEGELYRGMISNMGFGSMCVIPQEVRKKINKTHGDIITVELELDLEERKVEVPEFLLNALEKTPELKEIFDQLSYTNRKELSRSITSAKREETKIKRLAKALDFIRSKGK